MILDSEFKSIISEQLVATTKNNTLKYFIEFFIVNILKLEINIDTKNIRFRNWKSSSLISCN